MSPSRTSQAVAMTRAGFVRPHSHDGDPQSQRKLCAGMRTVVLTNMVAGLEARTRFFDDQVLAAIARGTRQVVVLGAGYDDRALRFRAPGVTFFELDHPETQNDKLARLNAIRTARSGIQQARTKWAESAELGWPVLAPADFRQDDVAAVLAACGHDQSRSSLFVCEGLLVYLDRPTTTGLLARLRAVAGPSSLLAASLAVHADGLDSARVLEVANSRRATADAEPWLTMLPAEAQIGLLAEGGWRIRTILDPAELGTGAPAGRSLLVTAEPGD